jgi:DNA-binding PadR family transcriptional regulator
MQPVSLYPTSTEERTGSAARRIYRATTAGARALAAAKLKVREVFDDEADEP